MTRPPLSIVVPSRDRPEQLARCVASVRAAMGPEDELIVVDSASQPPIALADTRVVRVERPGVNRARNAGWHAATHDLLAYVDDDVVVDPGWADAFATSAAAHPDAAFITGRLGALDAGANHGGVAVKDDAEAATLDGDSRGDLGHGANLLVRASALVAVGGWDDALGNGGRFKSAPEADLYDRLFAAGYVGRYEPTAAARHEQWRSSSQLVRLDWRYGFGNGARLAKLVRTDHRRARRVGGEALWGWGLQRLGAPIRDRNKTEVARVAARLAGTAAGFARAAFVPVRNGHFVDRW
ncbi:MAG TPA: glycosyltransferase [Acidimicrobiales bacterium]|nr:glycosyltransferase [Acidimicrobiales bacterium]